jgi:hypothetical protein
LYYKDPTKHVGSVRPQTSSLRNVICSRHDTAEKSVNFELSNKKQNKKPHSVLYYLFMFNASVLDVDLRVSE